MTEFIKYKHLERFGNKAVEGIELGTCHIFPKIDGTNASVWWDIDKEKLVCASRNKVLEESADNAGFRAWATSNLGLVELCSINPHLVFYGEWLVPHTLKTYRENTWRNFYVFDVYDREVGQWIEWDYYSEILDGYHISHIPKLATIKNPSYEQLQGLMTINTYLMQDGHVGEGIVIKNYNFTNQYGRLEFAKLVRNEFKEEHRQEMGAPEGKGPDLVEEKMVEKCLTQAMVDKVYAKIKTENEGWEGRLVPQLLGRVWHDLVNEELWDFISKGKTKNPTINFKTLQHFCFQRTKALLPEVF